MELSVRTSFELWWRHSWAVLVVLSTTAQCLQLTNDGSAANTPSSYDKAFRLLQTGHPDAALAQIDNALAAQPDDASLINLRGLVAAKLGRTGEAEAGFKRVIQLVPRATMGYNNLAALLWELGRQDEAANLFRQALTQEPQNFTALVGLGTTLAETQKYGEAALYLEKAWTSHPGDFQAGYELARSLQELKRPAEAHKILRKLKPPEDTASAAKFYVLSALLAEQVGEGHAAKRYYARAYELSPQSFDIYLALLRASISTPGAYVAQLPPAPAALSADQHFALGLVFASGGDYPAAIPHFQQTLELQPTRSSAIYNLALAYKQEGQSQAAIEVLERALQRQPNGELHNLLASLEEEAGRYVEAVRDYQHAVDLDPGNEQYYFDLGAEYLLHLTFDPAVEVFQIGSKKFPTSPRLYVGRGLAQFALRQYDEAADAFLSALEIDPALPDAFLAWNALPPFVILDGWETIEPRLQRLAKRYPENAQAIYCYAASLSRHGAASRRVEDLDLAQPLLEKAVQLNPKLAVAHLELGTLYAEHKQKDKAVASFRAAIRLDPNSEMAHYRLGQIYRDLKQLTLAAQELDLYRQLSRSHQDEMAQTRRAIRQFVLAKPAPRSTDDKSPL
jgi:tetratricopeptide (TPR) repeat protein